MHINYWHVSTPFSFRGIISALLARKIDENFIDIGIRYRVTSGSINSIRLFHASNSLFQDRAVDLSRHVLNEKTNDLIFGVNATAHGTIVNYKFSGEEICFRVVPVTRSERINSNETRIILDATVGASEDWQYCRFRIPFCADTQMYSKKPWGRAKSGRIFNLSISDVRGSIEARNSSVHWRENLVPIEHCFAFLIAPINYVPVLCSPIQHYTRLLEADVWKDYLSDGNALTVRSGSAIHQWRSGRLIDLNSPFRVHAHLHREFGFGLVIGTILLGLLGALLRWFGPSANGS